MNSSSFVSSNRSCNTQSCPMWSDWRPDGAGCRESCFQLHTRDCMQGSAIVDSNKCLSTFAPKIKNDTHKLIPCSVGACQTLLTTTSSSSEHPTTLAFAKTTATKTATTNEKTNFNKKISDIVLGSNSFWIGYCLGFASMLFLIIIILLILLKTRKGKAAIAVMQSFNTKTLSKKKIRHNSTNNNKARPSQFNSPQPLVNRKLEGKMSGMSTSSLCKEENYNINPHSASYSQPKYLESFSERIEPIDYETFYSPVGESRLHDKSTRGIMSSFFANMQDSHRCSGSSESFTTDSETERKSDQRCVSEIYDPDALYQNGVLYSTIGKDSKQSKKPDDSEFDNAACAKKPEDMRTENRIQEKKYDVQKRNYERKRAQRQRKSIDSQSTIEYSKPNEPHYATPMKNAAEAKNTAQQPLNGLVDKKENIKASSIKTTMESIKNKSKKMNSEGTYQSFEFTSPPPYVVDEQSTLEGRKLQENEI